MWEVFTGGKTGHAQNKQKMIDFEDELEWDHGEGSDAFQFGKWKKNDH